MPGRGLANGVRGKDRTRSYANIQPKIGAINANMPVRKTPTLSGDPSMDDGATVDAERRAPARAATTGRPGAQESRMTFHHVSNGSEPSW